MKYNWLSICGIMGQPMLLIMEHIYEMFEEKQYLTSNKTHCPKSLNSSRNPGVWIWCRQGCDINDQNQKPKLLLYSATIDFKSLQWLEGRLFKGHLQGMKKIVDDKFVTHFCNKQLQLQLWIKHMYCTNHIIVSFIISFVNIWWIPNSVIGFLFPILQKKKQSCTSFFFLLSKIALT